MKITTVWLRALPLGSLCLGLVPASLPALVGCSSAREAGEAAPEESVNPGINERFLSPELDVESFVDLFEGESREIAFERERLVGILELRSGMEVADVGAGTGLFLSPLAQAVGSDGRLYAVDISPGFVELLRERADEGGFTNVEAVLCRQDSVSLPESSVDLVFLCDTYHHFEYPRSTLASIRRALRPGGSLVVVDFERIPGVSREFILGHVRAGKDVFTAEIQEAGFVLEEEIEVEGLLENYVLRFQSP